MRMEQWKSAWLSEEQRSFTGWDFSSLEGRMQGEALPWNYEAIVKAHLGETITLLDMGTGGGEFLLSLAPPPGRTFATEAYPPNVELCMKKLPPHGIELRQVFDDEILPFEDQTFDLVINRHEAFSAQEVYRILKPGGLFITQQVGGRNNRELSRILLGEQAPPDDDSFCAAEVSGLLRRAGFTVTRTEEAYLELSFLDVGALVYFAKIIEWEFPGFTVERCYDRLCQLQEQLELDGCIRSNEHRFLIVACK